MQTIVKELAGKSCRAQEMTEEWDEAKRVTDKLMKEKHLIGLQSDTKDKQVANTLLTRVEEMQSLLNDNATVLSTHTVSSVQDWIAATRVHLNSLLRKRASRFRFKSRPAADIVEHGYCNEQDSNQRASSSSIEIEHESEHDNDNEIETGVIRIVGRCDDDALLLMDIDHDVVELTDLKRCNVRVGGCKVLRLLRCSDCSVSACTDVIDSGVYVNDCRRLRLAVATSQFRADRLHECELHSAFRRGGGPMIENSTDVRVAPLRVDDADSLRRLNAAGIQVDGDTWRNVSDFSWLKRGTPSPNWRVLDANERHRF
jgi:Tubulin binding cofactor C